MSPIIRRMLRKLSYAILPVVLLTLGVFNWSTTCCCGNSMILEILHGTCAHHGEEHDGSDHSSSDPHPCHKGGGDAFLKAANPDISYSPVAINLPVESTYLVSCTPSPVAAAWMVPRGAPPDIPLLTQRWLI
ncbi:hypothetical protein ACFL2F_01695 [Myxococcota bacterium]